MLCRGSTTGTPHVAEHRRARNAVEVRTNKACRPRKCAMDAGCDPAIRRCDFNQCIGICLRGHLSKACRWERVGAGRIRWPTTARCEAPADWNVDCCAVPVNAKHPEGGARANATATEPYATELVYCLWGPSMRRATRPATAGGCSARLARLSRGQQLARCE